jgi:FxsC-like protein
MAPWFFLSYSRRDDVSGRFVRIFYEKLADAVLQKLGLAANVKREEAGFFDQQFEPGEYWPEKISEALRTCRTFVCLMSRSYIRSRYCGKEFTIFQERLSNLEPKPPLILPLVWDWPDQVRAELPKVFEPIQIPFDAPQKNYGKFGLFSLVRNRRCDEFVDLFARRLVTAAENFPLSEAGSIQPLAGVESAFHNPSDKARLGVGPNAANFIFIAGRQSDFLGVRKFTDSYGREGGHDWRPYHPQIKEEIGKVSEMVASSESLSYQEFPISDELISQIRAAEETNTVVIIIVDPWSVNIKRLQEPMRQFDQNNFLNCGLLIPWNEKDGETLKSSDILVGQVEAMLSRTFITNNVYLRRHVRSHDDLKEEIIGAIGEVRRRMLHRAAVFQKIAGAASGSIPKISGISGGSHEK